MKLDTRIRYWTMGEVYLNFGDYLTEFIAEKALINPILQSDVYRLIGSAIHASIIDSDLNTLAEIKSNSKIVFWGCGMRDKSPIPQQLLERCVFMGIRGPLSRDVLKLPITTPIGDPGFLLPILRKPNKIDLVSGRSICIPHFSERDKHSLRNLAGADLMLSPAVRNAEELCSLIDHIASAKFILCGSLHAAIIACAYNKPFAFWDTGFVDIPFKWADFAASISVKLNFVSNVEDGEAFYASIKDTIIKPKLLSILGCCPFSVRPAVMASALTYDINIAPTTAYAINSIAQTLWLEDPKNIKMLKQMEFERSESNATTRASILQQTRKVQVEEITRQIKDVEWLSNQLAKRKYLASLTISHQQASILFSAESGAVALLENGWSTPNSIGPWSLAPISCIKIPRGSGWEAANAMILNGYLFAPHIGPSPSKRRIRVWLNSTQVFDKELENASVDHTLWISIKIPIADAARASGADLKFEISLSDVGSNKRLGIMDDDREIGLALAEMTFLFE